MISSSTPPTFSPRLHPESVADQTTSTAASTTSASMTLLVVVQVLLGGLAIGVPWWVWLAPAVSIGFAKVLLTTLGLSAAIIILALLALRSRSVTSFVPLPLVGWWLFVIIVACAALLSVDSRIGLVGRLFEVHTVGFVAMWGMFATCLLVFQNSLRAVRWLLGCLAASYGLLLAWHAVRVLTGWNWLTLEWFASPVSSPFGTLNDVAVAASFVCIVGLIYLLGTKRTVTGDVLAVGGILAGLSMLVIIGFGIVWVLVGMFALLLLLFTISRDTFFSVSTANLAVRPHLITTMAALVCVLAAAQVMFGETLQQQVNRVTGISYIEVRPSPAATLAVLRGVYEEQAILGVGPNRFDAAWRVHRDPSIMTTTFWNTEFAAGSGYLPTWFVTTGLLGGGLLSVFFGLWFYFGYRTFLRPNPIHAEWYHYGVMGFAGATFIWFISAVYTPGVSVLLLAAICTGMAIVAASALRPHERVTFKLASDRRSGFVVMAAVLCVLLVTLGVVRFVTSEFSAHRAFAAVQTDSTMTVDEIVTALDEILQNHLHPPTLEAAARIQLALLTQLLAIPEPTDEDRRRFEATAIRAVRLAEAAVARTPTNPILHALRGGVYATLARAGVPEASQQVDVALTQAESLDPLNPQYPLLRAQLSIQAGDTDTAREYIAIALQRKPNFSEALLLLSQLEIELGNTAEALAVTQALVSFEPQNPVRHFQLGILLAATGESAAAIQALSTAIALDPNYANARYIRGLVLVEQGEISQALEDLERVAADNQDNSELQVLVANVRAGNTDQVPTISTVTPVSDRSQTSAESAVVVDGVPDSDLVSPVNVVPGSVVDAVADDEVAETPPPDTESVADDEDAAVDSSDTAE